MTKRFCDICGEEITAAPGESVVYVTVNKTVTENMAQQTTTLDAHEEHGPSLISVLSDTMGLPNFQLYIQKVTLYG